MNHDYMTLKEFCDRLSISASTAYRLIRNGTIPAKKINSKWKVPREYYLNLHRQTNHR